MKLLRPWPASIHKCFTTAILLSSVRLFRVWGGGWPTISLSFGIQLFGRSLLNGSVMNTIQNSCYEGVDIRIVYYVVRGNCGVQSRRDTHPHVVRYFIIIPEFCSTSAGKSTNSPRSRTPENNFSLQNRGKTLLQVEARIETRINSFRLYI